MIEWTRVVGLQVARRVVTLAFTLLTLFFVYLERERLSVHVPKMFRRLFGSSVDRLLRRVVSAIRAAVDGIVFVAVAEGAIMCAVYALAGAPHPILSGVLTGVFAPIPFAAPIVFGTVAVVLVVRGSIAAAVVVAVAGTLVLFIADHFVRPVIIGEGTSCRSSGRCLPSSAASSPSGWSASSWAQRSMAALLSIWRGWVEEMPEEGS